MERELEREREREREERESNHHQTTTAHNTNIHAPPFSPRHSSDCAREASRSARSSLVLLLLLLPLLLLLLLLLLLALLIHPVTLARHRAATLTLAHPHLLHLPAITRRNLSCLDAATTSVCKSSTPFSMARWTAWSTQADESRTRTRSSTARSCHATCVRAPSCSLRLKKLWWGSRERSREQQSLCGAMAWRSWIWTCQSAWR